MERSKSTSKTRKIKEETKICRKMTSPNNFNKIADNTQIVKSVENSSSIDFKVLLQHVIKVQEGHKFFRNSKRIVV